MIAGPCDVSRQPYQVDVPGHEIILAPIVKLRRDIEEVGTKAHDETMPPIQVCEGINYI